MKGLTLEQLVERDAAVTFPVRLELPLDEEPPPQVMENLRKLGKLGILNASALLALVGQAPIDPVNLVGTLMRLMPDGWVFSAYDFAMMRVLARSTEKTNVVIAAMHVDLMGDVIKFLAQNKAKQLTLYKEFKVEPNPTTWDTVQALITETIAAAEREAYE